MRLTIVAAFILITLAGVAKASPTAEDLFDQGQVAFTGHDYPTAIAKWEDSFAASREPELLFNIAQAYRLSGDCAHALATYRHFLSLAAASEQRPLAEEFVHELQLKCGLPPPPHVEPVPEQIENTGSGRNLKLVGIVTGGTGVVLVATGLLFGRRASTLGAEVTLACAVSCDWSAQQDKDAAGRRDAAIGYALDAVGLAAIAGGAIMYYIGDRKGTVDVSPRPREGGAVITWNGSW